MTLTEHRQSLDTAHAAPGGLNAPLRSPSTSAIPPAAVSAPPRPDPLPPKMRDAMLATVPSLRGFAVALCHNVDRADDLVQETLMRALANFHLFQPGTNLSAWLFTILRNLFRSEFRKRRREVEDKDGAYANQLTSPPEQHGRMAMEEFRRALAQLPADQREALLLVGASGFTYEETAAICATEVGTIKSRVHRARARLTSLIDL